MKRVRITIDPGEATLPRTFERATADDGPDVAVQVRNWNVATDPAAFLLRIEGEYDRFAALLESDPAVDEYELLSLSADECYCFVRGPGTADAWALWEQFQRGSLLTVPPAEWNPDGSYTFTAVGAETDVQAAVETTPASVGVTVEAVGGTRVAPESVVDRLSERQRAAVDAAVACGYYDVPRSGTLEDVASELECARSTAAEHLQKAESRILVGLFG